MLFNVDGKITHQSVHTLSPQDYFAHRCPGIVPAWSLWAFSVLPACILPLGFLSTSFPGTWGGDPADTAFLSSPVLWTHPSNEHMVAPELPQLSPCPLHPWTSALSQGLHYTTLTAPFARPLSDLSFSASCCGWFCFPRSQGHGPKPSDVRAGTWNHMC